MITPTKTSPHPTPEIAQKKSAAGPQLKVPPPPPPPSGGRTVGAGRTPARTPRHYPTPPTTATARMQGQNLHINVPPPPASTTRGTTSTTSFGSAIHQQHIQPPPPPQQIIVQGAGGSGRRPSMPPRAPRVGGILQVGHEQWDAFTGGSNDVNQPHLCQFTAQRKPTKFESFSSF